MASSKNPPDVRSLWLTWHDHTRSRAISRALGVPMLSYSRRRTGVLRHVEGCLWTIGALLKVRPQIIFVQNSFLLLLVCGLYRCLCAGGGIRIVADCHNKSLKRDLVGFLGPFFRAFKRWSFSQVDLVVVSNLLLAPIAQRLCARVAVLRDPLPELPTTGERSEALLSPLGLFGRYVLFVCSFEPDEPTTLILSAAKALSGEGLTVVITGDSTPVLSRGSGPRHPRVLLPGFVSRPVYDALLLNADVVVVLSEDTDCLMCGAYEAIAAERPLVLSDTPLLRAVFGGCATYSHHDLIPLLDAIQAGMGALGHDFACSKRSFQGAFQEEWQAFLGVLGPMLGSALPVAAGSPRNGCAPHC